MIEEEKTFGDGFDGSFASPATQARPQRRRTRIDLSLSQGWFWLNLFWEETIHRGKGREREEELSQEAPPP